VPIGSLASQTARTYLAGQSDDGWQRFTQLVAAVNGGNLASAQKAYDGFTKSPAADLANANPDSRLSQALNQVGAALQSGDIGLAQQALSTIRARPQNNASGSAPTPQVASPNIVPPDPNAPGGTLDVIA
jgi:hypothetical protein